MLAATIGVSGCTSADRSDNAAPSLVPPKGKGLAVGGIIPCAGIPVPGGPRYAAGTVTALKGRVRWQAMGDGSSAAIFPATMVALQNVSVEQRYSMALPPGDYVLQAQLPPPANIRPFTSVTVKAGVVSQVDIPNMCM